MIVKIVPIALFQTKLKLLNGVTPIKNIRIKINNAIEHQLESMFGKLLEISTPWLLKNFSSLKLTLFIKAKIKNITKGATLPTYPRANIQFIRILKMLKATVTILNKLSRDIPDLYVFIVTKLKAFIACIVAQKSLTFKEFALYSMVIFAFNNSYAAHCDSLKAVVNSYERQYSIPRNLLWSIASVESKGNPLAINLDGKAYVARTAKEAKFIVESFTDDGITNIDLGLTQINLKHHGKNFDGIDDMLDVNKNLNYAAQLLCKLYKLHGGWREAVQHYHSNTPKYYVKYARKVLAKWIKETTL